MRRNPKIDWARAVGKAMGSSKTLKTQTALARKSGVAQSTIGRILRAEVDPRSGNLQRIAKAFRISLAQLAELGQEDGERRVPGVPTEAPRREEQQTNTEGEQR